MAAQKHAATHMKCTTITKCLGGFDVLWKSTINPLWQIFGKRFVDSTKGKLDCGSYCR